MKPRISLRTLLIISLIFGVIIPWGWQSHQDWNVRQTIAEEKQRLKRQIAEQERINAELRAERDQLLASMYTDRFTPNVLQAVRIAAKRQRANTGMKGWLAMRTMSIRLKHFLLICLLLGAVAAPLAYRAMKRMELKSEIDGLERKLHKDWTDWVFYPPVKEPPPTPDEQRLSRLQKEYYRLGGRAKNTLPSPHYSP